MWQKNHAINEVFQKVRNFSYIKTGIKKGAPKCSFSVLVTVLAVISAG
ncbi:hypothetical protein SXCC_03241 [Gluconacetobacter sp. SXCC-1]|nr:hypothetical protein SXCC_03241 [Gluconacetobacter sp. SXCC-1]